MIRPGSTIGILGGGQLGKMTAIAAARLGYRCHVWSQDWISPAVQGVNRVTVADFTDYQAADRFRRAVDVVTLEWENIPVEILRYIGCRVPTHPSADVLEVTQNRCKEKRFIQKLGLETVRWIEIADLNSLGAGIAQIGYPCLLKTARLGYDGKGQYSIDSPTDRDRVIGELGAGSDRIEAILEQKVALHSELAVIVARSGDGECAVFPVTQTHHRDQILIQTVVPAALSMTIQEQAQRLAVQLSDELQGVGVLAVEFFLTEQGELLVNELAPRPHNSGHWTIDACYSSQFEQLIRAVCGLPLGNPERFADAVMENLLGDKIDTWPELLTRKNAKLHVYGKTRCRPWRKMGHVTYLWPRS